MFSVVLLEVVARCSKVVSWAWIVQVLKESCGINEVVCMKDMMQVKNYISFKLEIVLEEVSKIILAEFQGSFLPPTFHMVSKFFYMSGKVRVEIIHLLFLKSCYFYQLYYNRKN